MQNFELVECYYNQIYIHTIIVDLHIKNSVSAPYILNQNKQNKPKMPDSTAAAASTAASDPVTPPVFITPGIISITAGKQQLAARSHSQSSVDILPRM